MKNLTDLFKILELTHSQPQYGYVPAGIQQDDLSNLAEHQYLVALIGWQIALHLKSKGSKIDVLKVVELCLVHDIGELLGGDIALVYGRKNPKAKEYAKAFEAENIKFLSQFFGTQKEHLQALTHEGEQRGSDEALLAKIADYLEHPHYMHYTKSLPQTSYLKSTEGGLQLLASKMKDNVAKRELRSFIKVWAKNITKKDALQVLFGD